MFKITAAILAAAASLASSAVIPRDYDNYDSYSAPYESPAYEAPSSWAAPSSYAEPSSSYYEPSYYEPSSYAPEPTHSYSSSYYHEPSYYEPSYSHSTSTSYYEPKHTNTWYDNGHHDQYTTSTTSYWEPHPTPYYEHHDYEYTTTYTYWDDVYHTYYTTTSCYKPAYTDYPDKHYDTWYPQNDYKPTTTYSTPYAYATHIVKVGGPGLLSYDPPYVNAAPGDAIEFQFFEKNHTVTESTYGYPCDALDGGFKTGFVPNLENATPSYDQIKTLYVDSWDSRYFYCGQGDHCSKGMVFVLNPTAHYTAEKFKYRAMQWKDEYSHWDDKYHMKVVEHENYDYSTLPEIYLPYAAETEKYVLVLVKDDSTVVYLARDYERQYDGKLYTATAPYIPYKGYEEGHKYTWTLYRQPYDLYDFSGDWSYWNEENFKTSYGVEWLGAYYW